MVQSKRANHEEYLEERHKHVRFRRDKQGQRKNRRKPAVEYGRRNVLHDKDDFCVTFAASDYEAVHNVRAKVDAQSDTDD